MALSDNWRKYIVTAAVIGISLIALIYMTHRQTQGTGVKTKRVAASLSDTEKIELEAKRARDRLKKRCKSLQQTIEREKTFGRQMMRENKMDKARFVLRQKRFHQKLLHKSQSKLLKVQQTMEIAEQQQLLQGIEQELQALLNTTVRETDLRDLVNDTERAMSLRQEIDSLLSKQLSANDEEGVTAEMHELEEELEQMIAK